MTFGKERAVNISGISTGFLHVGVHGYNKQTTVAWKASKSSGITTTTKNEDMDVDTEGKVQCENCNAWVLERTLPLHQGFCLRNNVLCPWGCQQVFKKGSEELEQHWHCDQCDKVGNNREEREKHMDYCHTQKSCICNVFTTDSYEKMAEHRRTICSEKMITCRYCHVSNRFIPIEYMYSLLF